MSLSTRIGPLLDQIYAGSDPDHGLAPALEMLTKLTNSEMSVFLDFDIRTGNLVRWEAYNATEKKADEYAAHYALHDPRKQCFTDHPDQNIIVDYDFIDEKGIDSSEYYQGWLKQFNYRYFIGIRTRLSPDRVAAVTLQRTPRQGHAGRRETNIAALCRPHFERSLMLRRRFDDIGGTLSVANAALDAATHGILCVDATMSIRLVNRAARALADAGDGLRICRNALAACRSRDHRDLERAVGQACRASVSEDPVGGDGVVFLSRPDHCEPLMAQVVPAGRLGAIGNVRPHGQALALIFVSRPERGVVPPGDLLRAAFRLTPKEAELVRHLIAGRTLREAAARMDISYETGRYHLKAVFSKIGCRGQSDLVRRVSMLANRSS